MEWREYPAAAEEHGPPAATLTDNAMVFTTRLAGGKGGPNAFETELNRPGSTGGSDLTRRLSCACAQEVRPGDP
jgi:hypothetical protein